MAAGIAVGPVDAMLTTVTGTDGVYVQLHTGDPGSAGTSNVSSVTTRESVTWGSVSGGDVSMSNEPEWSSWAGTSPETETYISFWSASSSGTFGMSMALSASVTLNTGDSLTLTSASVSVSVAS